MLPKLHPLTGDVQRGDHLAGAIKPRTSANFVDLTGKRFGRLVVTARSPNRPGVREVRWTAVCDCGKECETEGRNLRKGCTTSCGCRLMELFEERRKTRRDITERFWEKVDQSKGADACWPWLGAKDPHGYGRFRTGSKADRTARTSLATHMALVLSGVEIPAGMHALHKCDNPPCCNPNHLFLGTQQDNMKDMDAKGRRASAIKASIYAVPSGGKPDDQQNLSP